MGSSKNPVEAGRVYVTAGGPFSSTGLPAAAVTYAPSGGPTRRVGKALGTKKADVAERPAAFDQVGLLIDRPPGAAGLPLT